MLEQALRLSRPLAKPCAFGDHLGKIDNFPQLLRLEQRLCVAKLLHDSYGARSTRPAEIIARMLDGRSRPLVSVTEQFLQLLINSLMISDEAKAIAAYRRIIPSDSNEELAKLLNDKEFRDLHRDAQLTLHYSSEDLARKCTERLEPGGPFSRADQDAISDDDETSLSRVTATGVPIRFRGDAIGSLVTARRQNAQMLPLLETVKTERLIDIGPHSASKLSHAIHDLVDHLWYMNLLNSRGLIERYDDLLSAIGNRKVRRVFARESETIASIAFGVRYRHAMPHGFSPIIRPEVIRSVLTQDQDPRNDRARAILDYLCLATYSPAILADEFNVYGRIYDPQAYLQSAMQPTSHSTFSEHSKLTRRRRHVPEYQSLGFAFSNYITELDEQRRKHGKIKVYFDDLVVGELNPWSPRFLSFFVEAHHELMDPRNKHLDTLTRAHVALERFLMEIASGQRLPNQCTITLSLEDLANQQIAGTIPLEHTQWFRSNPGFLTDRRRADDV